MRRNLISTKIASSTATSTGLLLTGILLTGIFAGCQNGSEVVYRKSVTTLSQKAKALMDAGDVDGAISRLESAVDLMPTEPTLLFNLAVAYEQSGKLPQAAEAFQHFIDAFPKSPLTSQALKSLAIVEETSADAMIARLVAAEKNPPKTTAAEAAQDQASGDSVEAAVQLYQKALGHYEQLAPQMKTPDEAQDLKQHIKSLNQRLTEVSAGQLESKPVPVSQ